MVEQRTHNPLVAGSNPAGPTTIAMKLLEEKIIELGQVKDGDVIKVDLFLNHQIDTQLIDKMADEFIRIFEEEKFTKVLTVETSGIALAYPVAQKLGLPLVYAKKKDSVNFDGELYSSKVISYTHFREFNVIVAKKLLNRDDNVLIIDDFLANASDLKGLLGICQQAEVKVGGIGIAIEKAYLNAGDDLRERGLRVESLAKIKDIDKHENKPIF